MTAKAGKGRQPNHEGNLMSNKALEKQELFTELERLRREVDDLKESKQDLENLLETAARHADAAENRLREKQEAVIKTMHDWNDYRIGMLHHIRHIISLVDGMTDLLPRNLTEEQLDYINAIRVSVGALMSVLTDIVDLFQIETGIAELEEKPFDLRVCVEKSLDRVVPKATQKQLNLTYMIAENTPDILIGDDARLQQILVNLLGNTVRLTDCGETAVLVRARNTKTTDDTSSPPNPAAYEVHFAVRSTGVGISPDRVQGLFQLYPSQHHEFGCSDLLGLAISKRLSELMGGRIWAESGKDKGLVFHFTIKARAEQERPYAWLWRTDPQLEGKRLLICSENAANRNIVALYARNWGMLVEEMDLFALEKKQVWRVSDILHQNDRWDAAILDTPLSETKIPVLGRISNAPPSLPLAALVSSCHSLSGVRRSSVGCLAKPLKPAEVHAVLEKLLGKKQIDKTKVRILLAEDNPINREVMLYLLKQLGCYADIACDGLKALTTLRKERYDVVFMDMKMPKMDGLAATHHIVKEWPAAQRPWIIAMTANAMQGDRELCLQAGMNDCISKPVRPEELAKALARHSAEGQKIC
ncbi:MAG: response regulator [Gammaproteobacteria bacterium]|nr:response regulator [Gammaproteobacteria bacterium]